MANNIPFIRGLNCTMRLYQNGSVLGNVLAKSWTCEENATEANDPVNGENRDRLDKVTNYYSATLELYQIDQSVMDAIQDAQTPDDDGVLPLVQDAAIQISQRDGGRAAYRLSECKFGPWSQSFSGRADAVMVTLKMRFRFWERINAI